MPGVGRWGTLQGVLIAAGTEFIRGTEGKKKLRRQVLRLQDKTCEERKLQEFQIPLQYVAHFVFQLMWQTFQMLTFPVSLRIDSF